MRMGPALREQRGSREVVAVEAVHHLVVAGVAERLVARAVHPRRLHQEIVQEARRELAQRGAVAARREPVGGVDLVRELHQVVRELGAHALDQGVARWRVLIAVRHVPGERRLELAEFHLRVFEREPSLGDQRLEALLARDAPVRVLQAEAARLSAARPRLDVAQVEHVLDVHQRVEQRYARDRALAVVTHRGDARLSAVGLVFVELDDDLFEDRSDLDGQPARPLERHAVLRDVEQLAAVTRVTHRELDGDPDGAELRALIAIGAEENAAPAHTLDFGKVCHLPERALPACDDPLSTDRLTLGEAVCRTGSMRPCERPRLYRISFHVLGPS
jgi:hypothetical protein